MKGKTVKSKILIVDDEEILKFTIEQFLLLDGYEVYKAGSYDEAISKIEKIEFDLIFADIVLQGKTGVDLLREIKDRNLTCPVVLITGNPEINTAAEAVRLGAYDYVPKPIKKDAILQTAKLALKHNELVNENEKYKLNLEAIFASVQDAIITVDQDLNIIEMNNASEQFFGISRSKAKGIAFKSLCKHCKTCFEQTIAKTVEKKQPLELRRFECRFNPKSNKIVNFSSYPLLQNNGTFKGYVLVIKDETYLDNLERNFQERHKYHNIIGKCNKMQKVYSLIENLSDILTTVLITGESGTGKELIAEALHFQGCRSKKPLVKVNSSALPDDLLESELFGHVKGAFTGAINNRIGRFKKADGGTIFLDEIGDISNKMQLRLLRVLQEMEFEQVGDSTPIKVDVRVVTATNQDLREKVRLGTFMEDLYHRLKVVELAIPPLRERREDLHLLITHFVEKFNNKFNNKIETVSENVLQLFMNYTWPGNIRELEHILEHASIICKGKIITLDDLPADFTNPENKIEKLNTVPQKTNFTTIDQESIIQALKNTGGNKTKAASQLGISRMYFYQLMKKYNI